MALLYVQFMVIQQMEQQEERNRTRIFRRMIRDAQDPFRISDREFIKHFRLTKEAAMDLIEALSPQLTDGVIAGKIRKPLRVLAALHFFATGSYHREVGSNHLACMSQSLVSRSLQEVTTAILRHIMGQWIRFPRNDVERDVLKEGFQNRYHMPCIIGIVDGTHVAIVQPYDNEHIYVNRKGYHSLNCQIVCDSTGRIINVVSQWPGSTHDAYIWRSSRVGQAMKANFDNGDMDTRIMGDSGYPCLPWLLIPVRNAQTPREEHYFTIPFLQCRSTVERCIGVLKGRFRCLLKDRVLHYSPRVATKIVIACAVLHNIALHYRIVDPEPMWDPIDLEPLPQPNVHDGIQDLQLRRMGQASRQQYINQFF